MMFNPDDNNKIPDENHLMINTYLTDFFMTAILIKLAVAGSIKLTGTGSIKLTGISNNTISDISHHRSAV
jgi:hypothetical protein